MNQQKAEKAREKAYMAVDACIDLLDDFELDLADRIKVRESLDRMRKVCTSLGR